ncbi:MAG: cation transporter [Rhodothermales bacterium]
MENLDPTMTASLYRIAKMDCSAEEQLVRLRLAGVAGIEHLNFDLTERTLLVEHSGSTPDITAALDHLGLGSELVSVSTISKRKDPYPSEDNDRRLLVGALIINASLFVGELAAGLIAGSMGLVADSLDMLADAFVYALSLAAVGTAMSSKKRLAGWSAYAQIALAIFGLVEVLRRFFVEQRVPDVSTMIVVAAVALAANIATLIILSKARRGEAHMEASWIFTSNDVIVNGLVIVSAVLVWFWNSSIPDLIAGGLIFAVVLNGARRILALSR